MTDVPGHTIALVPLLAEAGVELLHIGVNPASAVPDVPPAFRWHCGSDEVTVLYDGSYGGCRELPGGEALAFGHTGDNHGPQTDEQVAQQYTALRERFPGATVRAARLDDALPCLRAARAGLPVVEDEIGDSWIHGVGSDPHKTRRFRALARWRSAAIAANPSLASRPDLLRCSDDLLLVAKHTWGRDLKRWRTSDGWKTAFAWIEPSYTPAAFHAERAQGTYTHLEASWREQRTYLDQAVARLGSSTLHTAATNAQAEEVEESGPWIPGTQAEYAGCSAAFDPATGGLSHLSVAGRDWVGAGRPLGTLLHQLHGEAEYQAFIRWYNPDLPGNGHWSVADFTKPGMGEIQPESRNCLPRILRLLRSADGGALRAEFTFADDVPGALRSAACT